MFHSLFFKICCQNLPRNHLTPSPWGAKIKRHHLPSVFTTYLAQVCSIRNKNITGGYKSQPAEGVLSRLIT